MNKNNRYYSLFVNEETKNATIGIYGDITSFAIYDSDVSSYNLSKQLEELEDVERIDVFINSYGGEVAEGIAIYNALKRHSAKIVTHCNGFACSIASVIFAAGDERIMNESSILMIHDPFTYTSGNANELRKQAETLDKLANLSVQVYQKNSSLSEDEIKEMMKEETWILPEEALSYGFATSIENPGEEATQKVNQSAKNAVFNFFKENKTKAKKPKETSNLNSFFEALI